MLLVLLVLLVLPALLGAAGAYARCPTRWRTRNACVPNSDACVPNSDAVGRGTRVFRTRMRVLNSERGLIGSVGQRPGGAAVFGKRCMRDVLRAVGHGMRVSRMRSVNSERGLIGSVGQRPGGAAVFGKRCMRDVLRAVGHGMRVSRMRSVCVPNAEDPRTRNACVPNAEDPECGGKRGEQGGGGRSRGARHYGGSIPQPR